MREFVNIDEELLAHARDYTGIEGSAELIDRALRELIHREASRRIAAFGGTMPDAWAPNEGDPSPA